MMIQDEIRVKYNEYIRKNNNNPRYLVLDKNSIRKLKNELLSNFNFLYATAPSSSFGISIDPKFKALKYMGMVIVLPYNNDNLEIMEVAG